MQTHLQLRNDGIRRHTSDASNQRIDDETQQAIEQVEYSPALVRERLAEIDREWTVDRAVMLNFSILGGFTASMAMRNLYRHRKLGIFGAIFISQMAFLAHHAIRRWCPSLPVFRRLGFRSDHEISAERVALLRRLDQLSFR